MLNANPHVFIWHFERSCLPENAAAYLKILREDAPNTKFMTSKRQPRNLT